MYLTTKLYVGFDREAEIKATVKDIDPAGLGKYRLKFIEFEVGYWRKANQIHGWFVQNVQDGKDDRGNYPVLLEQLQDLKAVCEEVLNDHSLVQEKLPPRQGFFFGSYEIDEYYFRDLEDTLDILNKIFENPKHELWDLYYHSSW